MSFWSRVAGKFTGLGAQARTASIIADPHARGVECEFRLPNDPEYVIRINQRPPRGLARKLAEFVSVAGIAQPDTLSNAQAFIRGSDRKVELQPVPENPIDPNAIAVMARWREGDIERSGRLGYLPAEIAAQISNEEQGAVLGATLKVIYAPIPGRSPGLRLDVWTARRQRENVKEKPYRQDLRVPSDSVERNLLGIKLEAEGLIDNAIECYEANVRDGFGGNHPYDRLAVIFRRRRDAASEIRVMTRAIEVFEQLQSFPRSDVVPKLQKFRQRLRSASERSNSHLEP
jgi:hypothetical protein